MGQKDELEPESALSCNDLFYKGYRFNLRIVGFLHFPALTDHRSVSHAKAVCQSFKKIALTSRNALLSLNGRGDIFIPMKHATVAHVVADHEHCGQRNGDHHHDCQRGVF